MLFNSLHFIIFFIIIATVYYLVPGRYKLILLLISSLYFYMSWNVSYGILLGISILSVYVTTILISGSKDRFVKKCLLIMCEAVNLSMLFLFKYFNFFNDNLTALLGFVSIDYGFQGLDIILPIGISFYTFMALSYLIDVYRGDVEPERKLSIFALYMSFFPHLVAGPIMRAKELIPQFYEEHAFDLKNINFGILLMLWGFFKKIVVADRLALYVNPAYNDVMHQDGFTLAIATIFFAFQIYCDFSGYCDIAMGCALFLGYRLPENFRTPYFSTSIIEFWRRWHITLYNWLRDYVYIPLGGNRVSKTRYYMNILIIFMLSGLWHGANWTFVAWGLLLGIFVIMNIILNDALKNLKPELSDLLECKWATGAAGALVTFVVVDFCWIFFRANSIGDAFQILRIMATDAVAYLLSFNPANALVPLYSGQSSLLLLPLLAILATLVIEYANTRVSLLEYVSGRPMAARWAVYYVLVFLVLLAGVFGSNYFIYFQF